MTAHSRRDDPRAKLDALIDFQHQHGTDPRLPIHVALSPTEIGRLIGKLPRKGGTEFDYRGRVVIATAVDNAAMRFRGGA